MVALETKTKDFGGGSCMKTGEMGDRVEMSKANGIKTDMQAGSSELRDSLVTYKRRKTTKLVEGRRTQDDSVTQLGEKSVMHFFDEASQGRSNDPTIASINFSLKHPKNTVLEQIYQSLESECSLTKCIKSAIDFQPGSDSRTTIKESFNSCENGSKCTFLYGSTRDGPQNAATDNTCMTFNGSANEPSHGRLTEFCLTTFSNVIMSEKFAQLCIVLLEHFPGLKAGRLFDLSLISSRMKENLYERSPVLFHSDIQQIWTKLQKVGSDMVALAKCLSDKTSTSFHEQEFNQHTKGEQTEASALSEVHICRHCGDKADGRNGLVCDSCEEMYHISCILPPVKEIPSTSWYCANCTAKGIESPHINCVGCERLNASTSTINNIEVELGLEESSNEVNDKRFPNCKICTTEVTNDKDCRICGHPFCPHKFYHVQCLTNKQLVSYGPCWYCPSCLCRGCFVDQDDDKIVLCDGCDHAYHIYCMHPLRTTIPKGKWFCDKCDSGIQHVRKGKRSLENMRNDKTRKVTSGGVDMLLNAAKTLNCEENYRAKGL